MAARGCGPCLNNYIIQTCGTFSISLYILTCTCFTHTQTYGQVPKCENCGSERDFEFQVFVMLSCMYLHLDVGSDLYAYRGFHVFPCRMYRIAFIAAKAYCSCWVWIYLQLSQVFVVASIYKWIQPGWHMSCSWMHGILSHEQCARTVQCISMWIMMLSKWAHGTVAVSAYKHKFYVCIKPHPGRSVFCHGPRNLLHLLHHTELAA